MMTAGATTPKEWTWGDSPGPAGWYAISYCWDSQEGIFPGAARWTGEWLPKRPVGAFAGPFDDEASAKAWADEHDVEA